MGAPEEAFPCTTSFVKVGILHMLTTGQRVNGIGSSAQKGESR